MTTSHASLKPCWLAYTGEAPDIRSLRDGAAGSSHSLGHGSAQPLLLQHSPPDATPTSHVLHGALACKPGKPSDHCLSVGSCGGIATAPQQWQRSTESADGSRVMQLMQVMLRRPAVAESGVTPAWQAEKFRCRGRQESLAAHQSACWARPLWESLGRQVRQGTLHEQ